MFAGFTCRMARLSGWKARNFDAAPLIYTTSRGRPKFEVNREQILYLLSMSFSWKQIASILGVSYMTIYRRRQEYGIPSRGGRAISDIQLREHLHQLQQDLPS